MNPEVNAVEMKGRISFKGPNNEPWLVKFTAEKMNDGKTLISIIQLRNNKNYGPQLDFSFAGKPCEFLKQARPFALIGQETKKGVWFSSSLVAKNK